MKAHVSNTAIRSEQVGQLCSFIDTHSDKSVVLCGDFNDEPDSEPLQKLGGHPTLKSSNEDLVKMRDNSSPLFTTMKFREPKMTKRIIDYHFYSGLTCVGALDMPKEEDLNQEVGNPCADHPSDHYAMCYRY